MSRIHTTIRQSDVSEIVCRISSRKSPYDTLINKILGNTYNTFEDGRKYHTVMAGTVDKGGFLSFPGCNTYLINWH